MYRRPTIWLGEWAIFEEESTISPLFLFKTMRWYIGETNMFFVHLYSENGAVIQIKIYL